MTLNPLVLNDADIYLGAADLSGYSNKVSIAAKPTTQERTTFNSGGWQEFVGGLFTGQASVAGFFQAGDLTQPDDALWAALSSAGTPLTVIPTGGAAGDLAYLSQVTETDYTPGAQVGDLLAFTANANTNWPAVRGNVLHPANTARTATGNGTAVLVGAASASQALYVCLHTQSYVDGSLTVAVQSDDNSGMSSPTTVGTFTAVTSLSGSQTMRIVGPATDTYYRIAYTITGGTTHSFQFAVSAGIGPK